MLGAGGLRAGTHRQGPIDPPGPPLTPRSPAATATDRPTQPRRYAGAIRTAVLTISSTVSRREAEDESGPVLASLAEDAGCDVIAMEVIPDDFSLIEDRLHHYVEDGFDLIFTTGGTGLTPDDITPRPRAP